MPTWTVAEWATILAAAGACVTAIMTQLLLVLRHLRHMRGELRTAHGRTHYQVEVLRLELKEAKDRLDNALLYAAELEKQIFTAQAPSPATEREREAGH